MRPYLIANEVTPVNVGDEHRMLPLHSTLVHWFWLDEAIHTDELTDTVADATRRNVRLIPDRLETFTAPTDEGMIPVTVTTLHRTPELIDLHERVVSSLTVLDPVYEAPQYIHEGFRPHITHQLGETVSERGYVSRNLYIATADRPAYGSLRTIVAKVALNSK